MNDGHTRETPRQPLPSASCDPVAVYLDFLEKISEDVDQIPDRKIDERARQLFGEPMMSNGLSSQGGSFEGVSGLGRPQQADFDCLLETIIEPVDVLKGMPLEMSGVVEIVAAAQREADRIRWLARQEALAEAAYIRAQAKRDADALMDTALTQAAHIRAEADRDAKTLIESTHEQVALLRRLAANAQSVSANTVDADESKGLEESERQASQVERWLDEDAGPIVPAYLLTRGRTVPASEDIDLISVIITADDLAPPVGMGPEHLTILQKCTKPTRLVDVAAELNLPISVVRVLVGDLHAQELVRVENPPPAPDARVVLKVLSNLIAM
ncbi:DUF742 domain-containing protein [Nonomuraea sp. NPDC052116]|uniref:DUF742 domain-containing protein n=1 Tax=Nonomuraea sp. NPDC052116 TaxID=3155665 RepID=UPI00341CD02A